MVIAGASDKEMNGFENKFGPCFLWKGGNK